MGAWSLHPMGNDDALNVRDDFLDFIQENHSNSL